MTEMVVEGTLVEHYPQYGLWVKREDLCCPGGPNFSKTRGVYAHVRARNEGVIGVLDTDHSQGGWAVARACQLLGKKCVNFFPLRKADREKPFRELCVDHPQWWESRGLGATMTTLQAGRSSVLYHQAKKMLLEHEDRVDHGPTDGLADVKTYMMPNALKLPEMVEETAAEVARTPIPDVDTVLISASSGTIAAGVIVGLCQKGFGGRIIVHQGYSRPEGAMRNYMGKMAYDLSNTLHFGGRHPGGQLWRDFDVVDEGYAYADRARPGETPPFSCNEFYDLKAFRWWMREGRAKHGSALLWNVG